jgi:hypothetical protein
MSKAIAGAVMIAADLAIGAVLFLQPELLGLLAAGPMGINVLNGIIMGLFAGGVSMEAGALAQALTSNRGENITVRTPAGLRQIVYGMQRIGGNIVYQSTTGAGGASGNYVYNYIIVLATHECDALVNLYLDGRQVFWRRDGNIANIGCGSVQVNGVPVLTCTVTIAGGAVTGITYTGTPSGYNNVKASRYRVRIWGGGGSGALAYATNAGTGSIPIFTIVLVNGGSGYTSPPRAEIQGAYVFGGVAAADQQDPAQPGYGNGYGIAPSGEHYNFSGKVFAELRLGAIFPGDYMSSLSANDSVWPATAQLAGCTYLYLNLGYDAQLFPSPPEIRVTINGKNTIYDPRTGRTTFTTNWALQVADVLTDPDWGLGDTGSVNSAQLVAAANVCDELVTTASQGAERRYAQHIHYDTSTAPGDALQMMMPTAAGRLGRIGGEWWIWPAYWQGASFAFSQANLIDAPTWTPYRSFKELFNRVTGTYVAPNYPYNVAGNLYDKNGWYYGTHDNVWPFAWEPTNYPQYAADSLHGYASDQYLAEDGGQQLPRELSFRGVISISQAQRVAKIALLRNRFQGSGSFRMGLEAWQVQPVDVIAFTWAILGMSAHLLEVSGIDFVIEPVPNQSGKEDNQTLALSVAVTVAETDPSIYQWSIVEELSPYDVPASARQIPATPAAPTSFTVTSSAGTALVGADGIVIPRARLDWAAPLDNSVTAIQMQYQAGDVGTLGIVAIEVVYVQKNHVGLFHYVLIVSFASPPTVSDGAQCNFAGLTTYTALNGQALTWHYIDPIAYGLFMDANSLAFFFGTATYAAASDTGAMGVDAVPTTQWIEAGSVDVNLFYAFVAGLVAGQTYNFRIRSIRVPGVWSAWVEVDGALISVTLSNTTGTGYSVAPAGTLTSQALADGTAQITVATFTAVWGALSVFCSPSPHILGSLNQAQLYYVYYVDPAFAGGAITPIATELASDFSNRVGYFMIGSIVTPSYVARYSPGSFSDVGSNTTQNPSAAYDSDVTTSAMVIANLWSLYFAAVPIWNRYTANGDCVWAGFPNISKAGSLTLHVLCSCDVSAGTSATMQIIAHVGSSNTVLHTFTGAATQADYTLTLNPGVVLSTVSVEATASISAPAPGPSDLSGWAHLMGFEIYIQ